MRPTIGRAVTAMMLAGLTFVAASGCARVDLADEWPALAEPTGWQPKANTCHTNFAESSYRASYNPLDCTKSHSYETVHVGEFKGDAAALNAPPARNSTAITAAWVECDAKTTEYLGEEWRNGRIWVGVSVPSGGNWSSGARWFRCEVAVTQALFGQIGSWSKSLKGEFAAASELKLGCYEVPKEGEATAKACNESHNAEYVGSFPSVDSWDTLKDNRDNVHQKCRSLIAVYVGVPDDGNMKYRTGSYYSYADKEDWEAGDKGIRCHLYFDTKKLTSSLKGGGAKALPLR